MSATRKIALVAALSVALVGCPKSGGGGEDAGTKTGTASSASGATPGAEAGASAEAGAGTGSASGRSASFAGKYSVAVGAMYVPAAKDWSSVKFKNDDTKLLGEGTMTIAIDGTGRVSGGTEDGPLGASVLDGTSDGATLTATIRRKDPTDMGLTGTLVAKVAGAALEGTMNLAEASAAVVRVGTITATKK